MIAAVRALGNRVETIYRDLLALKAALRAVEQKLRALAGSLSGLGGGGGGAVVPVQVSGGDIASGNTGTVTEYLPADGSTATGSAYTALLRLGGTATNLSKGYIAQTSAGWEIISIDC